MDDYRDLDEIVIRLLRAKVKAYNAAADKFIKKVESGKAFSKETYADLKYARDLKENI